MEFSRLQDTPAVKLLRLLADLMGLNLLVLLCSIPVVTAGTALSAMYAVLFSRERNEGTVAVIPTFFRAFISGFGKSTVLGLIMLLLCGVAIGDIWYGSVMQSAIGKIFVVVGTIVAIVALILFLLAFAQQSTYQNSIKNYIQNSFSLAFCAPGKLLRVFLAWFLPWALLAAYPEVFLLRFGFVYLLWGFSFPAWVTARLLNDLFLKTEQNNSDT